MVFNKIKNIKTQIESRLKVKWQKAYIKLISLDSTTIMNVLATYLYFMQSSLLSSGCCKTRSTSSSKISGRRKLNQKMKNVGMLSLCSKYICCQLSLNSTVLPSLTHLFPVVHIQLLFLSSSTKFVLLCICQRSLIKIISV